MTPDFSELIQRLKSRAVQLRKYGVNPAAEILDEAATALQSLTSTIAGLEVDAERYRKFCSLVEKDEFVAEQWIGGNLSECFMDKDALDFALDAEGVTDAPV